MFLEHEDLPEVVEEWDETPPGGQEHFQDMWYMEVIDNDLIPLEKYHRDGY